MPSRAFSLATGSAAGEAGNWLDEMRGAPVGVMSFEE